MKTISSTSLPKECWIFEKKRYRYSAELPELPFVSSVYECILKAHNIPYRKIVKLSSFINDYEAREVCEYWSPEVYEERELTLPLFARMPDFSYRYCEKNYTHTVPTPETIKAASETAKFVEEQIKNYEQILREVSHYRFAKEQLAGEILKVCRSTNTPYKSVYDISMNNENFKILRVFGFLGYTDWVAIFDMNKIARNGYLTLQVPKHILGLVVGRDGANIKAWAKELGVKKIQVIPIQE